MPSRPHFDFELHCILQRLAHHACAQKDAESCQAGRSAKGGERQRCQSAGANNMRGPATTRRGTTGYARERPHTQTTKTDQPCVDAPPKHPAFACPPQSACGAHNIPGCRRPPGSRSLAATDAPMNCGGLELGGPVVAPRVVPKIDGLASRMAAASPPSMQNHGALLLTSIMSNSVEFVPPSIGRATGKC